MLTDSPLVRSPGPRILFVLGAILSVAILEWLHHLRLQGGIAGLTDIFFDQFAYEDYGATICELLMLVAAVFVASRIPFRGVLRAAGEHPGIIAVLAAAGLSAAALFVYHDHPLSMDEYAAYFQSQVFAGGHLAARFPPALIDWLVARDYQNQLLDVSHSTGAIAASQWPGHSLLLAPFTMLGIPWVCNPLLSALTAYIVHRLAIEMFANVEAAGLALLLTVASPVILGMGISFYSMPAHLFCNCLYALLLIRPTAARAIAAGFVGSGALCLDSPVPHLLFALPWMIWIGTRPGGMRLLTLMLAGYLPLCLLLGVGWYQFSNALRSAGPDAPAPATALERLRESLSVLHAPTATVLLTRFIGVLKVWIWAVPGLLILAAYGAARWRRNTHCLLFAASALTTLIAYLFYPPDQGHGWGYRYFHSAWVALPLLATAALFAPSRTGGGSSGGDSATLFAGPATHSYVTACVVLSLVFGLGFRAWQMQNYLTRDLNQLPQYHGTEHQVVLIDTRLTYYGADLVQNDPWLRGNVIRMISHGQTEDRQFMAQYDPRMQPVFADRHGWVWSAGQQSQSHANGMAGKVIDDAASEH